jgi:hypothetical protein
MGNQILIARIFGGLGNQLFCYAAARRLALVNHAELVLDDVSGFENDRVYKRHYQLDHFNIPSRKATPNERFEPFPRTRRFLRRHYNKMRSFERRDYIVQEGQGFEPRLLGLKLTGSLYLEGYWQSEGYFRDVEKVIRQEIQVKPPMDTINIDVAKDIESRHAVAVHVRFFDAPGVGGVDNVLDDYYGRAVTLMEERTLDSHYYIFSDSPEAAREKIPLPDDRITLVAHNKGDENAYSDLWLMSKCSNFIIANSTFSWWGAWLSSNPDAIVVSPGKLGEMGRSWGFDGLIPNRWIRI